jgi:tRNA-specific 2-thiouridylase
VCLVFAYDIVSLSTPFADVKLLTAHDSFKDQTFFLSHIKQSSLKKTLFPIGHLLKSQVRKLASDNDLSHVANRPGSTGICFIGRRNFQDFICEVPYTSTTEPILLPIMLFIVYIR